MSFIDKIIGNKALKSFKKYSKALDDVKNSLQHQDAMNYKNTSGTNDIIFQRLEIATESEIRELCEALKIVYFSGIPIGYISKEYRKAAGHSMVNIARSSHELPYKRILIDVADKLKPGMKWTEFKMDDAFSEIEIEDDILKFVAVRFEKQFQKLSTKKKKEVEDILRKELQKDGIKQTAINSTIAALSSGGIGAALAGTAATTIFAETAIVGTLTNVLAGTGLIAVHVAPTASQVALAGTGVGAVVAIPILIGTLGGPAYRKTIPATLKMVAIRKRYESKNNL